VIFIKIKINSKVCFEFDAWDGIHFSNSRNLILNGCSVHMIKVNQIKYNHLFEIHPDNLNLFSVN
jgi:hypothetical protein